MERWIFGYYTVKYAQEHDPVKKPLLGMKWCSEEATVSVEHEGLAFHWCEKHAKEPTCGVSVVKPT